MVSILSVFNNISSGDRLKSAWGSSFFVTKESEKILFDTGSDAEILLYNLKTLNINPAEIQKIVISHKHYDHTGALLHILKENRGSISLYLPSSFKNGEAGKLKPYCKDLQGISKEKFKINDNLYSSGAMGFFIEEQALVIDLPVGLIVITGCAHPGIINMCKNIKNSFTKDIYAVLGGFHLEYYPGFMIKRLFNRFRDMGIKRIGPSHCSGKKAFDILKNNFKDEFVDLSLGKKLILD